MLFECRDQRLVDVGDRPSRTAQVKDALVLVQHSYKCLHVVQHLVLDIYFLGTITRKGESRLGNDTVLDKRLDLWDECQQDSKTSADSARKYISWLTFVP